MYEASLESTVLFFQGDDEREGGQTTRVIPHFCVL